MANSKKETIIAHLEAKRTEKDSVIISWKSNIEDPIISIHVSESPNVFDRNAPVNIAKSRTHAKISGLKDDARYYFKVVPVDGPSAITAERLVPMEGSVNFRDLGGYRTLDGHTIKWGQIFRSDNLGRLTDRDQALLGQMGIKRIFDFRTPAEAKKRPDRLPPGGSIKYFHLPIVHGEFDPALALDRIKSGDVDWISMEFLAEGYIRNIEEFPHVWGTVFNRLAEEGSTPGLFHCTGGKDRAGICSALILITLGVPEETVIYDHSLSNVFIADIVDSILKRISTYGVDPERVAPYFTAPKKCMVTLLDHIRETYGSATNYLMEKADVKHKTLNQIKEKLLE